MTSKAMKKYHETLCEISVHVHDSTALIAVICPMIANYAIVTNRKQRRFLYFSDGGLHAQFGRYLNHGSLFSALSLLNPPTINPHAIDFLEYEELLCGLWAQSRIWYRCCDRIRLEMIFDVIYDQTPPIKFKVLPLTKPRPFEIPENISALFEPNPLGVGGRLTLLTAWPQSIVLTKKGQLCFKRANCV